MHTLRPTIVALALLAALPARAESEFVLLNTYREAAGAERWGETTRIFAQLRGTPAAEDPGVRCLHARALLELDRLDRAAAALDSLLEDEPRHVEALFLLAQVHAKRAQRAPDPHARQRCWRESRALLLRSAASGQFVCRDLQDPRHAELFAELARDPRFVVAVLRASRAQPVSAGALHDPFRSALRTTEAPREALPPAYDPELEARLGALYAELVQLAREERLSELVETIEEVRALLARYGPAAADASRKVRGCGGDMLREFDVLVRMLKLQEWVHEGNGALKAMRQALEDAEFDAALEAFAEIERIAEAMHQEPDPIFARNAEGLLARGRHLAERARLHREIAALELVISGVVVASQARGIENAYDSAIVNDRILRIGDAVFRSPRSNEADPNLTLEAISPEGTTLTFSYRGTKFVRGRGR